jgi:DNA-binding transcriptional LysR family regulator
MEMQQVRYFLAVAETLNFTRAAAQCQVSQPALTRGIKLLEAELGDELIRREGRLTHLTELGARLLPILRQCYDSAVSAKAVAAAVTAGEATTLRLAITPVLDLQLIMPMLRELRRVYPGLRLKLRRAAPDGIATMLKRGEADLAICALLEDEWDRFEARPIFTEGFDLLFPADHPLAAEAGVVPVAAAAKAGETFVLHRGAGLNGGAVAALEAAGVDSGRAHEVDRCDDMIALVEAGVGVGVVPASGLAVTQLRRRRGVGLPLSRTIAIYAVTGRPQPREAAALVNLLRAADWSAVAAPAAA